jgi:hypothetical protein
MTETELAKAIRDAVNQSGMGYVERVQSGTRSGGKMRFAGSGTPDALGYVRDGSGRLLAIEIKTPDGKLRPAQKEWMMRATSAGALCIVARTQQEALEALRDDRKRRMGR